MFSQSWCINRFMNNDQMSGTMPRTLGINGTPSLIAL